jgi:hypothetical protein
LIPTTGLITAALCRKDEKLSRNSETPHQEICRLLKEIAGKASAGETEDVLIRRAAYRVGITYSKARAYWYLDARRVDSEHMDAARAKAPSKEVIAAIAAVESVWLTPSLENTVAAVEAVARVAGEILGRLPCAAVRAVNSTLRILLPRMVA